MKFSVNFYKRKGVKKRKRIGKEVQIFTLFFIKHIIFNLIKKPKRR